jgi:3-oxoadipate enol-lactonase
VTGPRIKQAIGADLSVDVRKQAQTIKSPTLVITAKHDQIVPLAYSRDLLSLIPHAHEIDFDSGHLIFFGEATRFGLSHSQLLLSL